MHVHFIAIGGSAMHNLALALHDTGHIVTGSDDQINEPSRSRLANSGLLPKTLGWFPERITAKVDRVILGMHAREDNPELLQAQDLGLKIQSYPEFLFEMNANKRRLVIGGSHGKTTITSMLMHALRGSDQSFNYMVGAQLEGFDRMVALNSTGDWAIFEGDEYLSSPIDRRPKFLWYRPEVALLSSVAWDHINVFPTEASYAQQFSLFLETVEYGGHVVWCEENENLREVVASCNRDDIHWVSYRTPDHESTKDGLTRITFEDGCRIETALVGKHNYQNMAGARELARLMGMDVTKFDSLISGFKGAARRLEVFAEGPAFTVYRDFAHAPSKLAATTAAVKSAFPGRKLTAIFELHTFSSLNRDFLPTYERALESADDAIVFYSPDVLKLKKLPALDPSFVQACFDRTGRVRVVTSPRDIETHLSKLDLNNRTVLLMSSGWFQGADLQGAMGLPQSHIK